MSLSLSGYLCKDKVKFTTIRGNLTITKSSTGQSNTVQQWKYATISFWSSNLDQVKVGFSKFILILILTSYKRIHKEL